MATNVLRGIGARIDALPAHALDRAVDVFVEIAERNGGRMMRRYQLTAKPQGRRVTRSGASVVMQGVPSGFWTWRETGIAEHAIRPRRAKALQGAGYAHPYGGTVVHPGVAGRHLWTKTTTEADVVIRRLWETMSSTDLARAA